MRAIILAVFLSGCVTASDGLAREEAALARELEGRVAGEPVSCIPMRAGQSLQISGPETLVLREGRTTWVNRLERSCRGLRPLDQLIVEPSLGGRYCRNDRFRAQPVGTTIPGPYCLLGNFTPYRRP
jgi:hypothetical protein